MNRWFISDTHFSHTNIIRYTGRPFQSVNEMDERLIENWNELVQSQDTVFFLGDFGLGTTDFLASLCARLHGNKICIRGNHDGSPAKMHKIGFMLALESAFIKIGRHQVELVHVPSQPAPPHFQLHGHVHEKRPNKLIDRQLNLSVEVWNYKPVSEKTLISLLDSAQGDMYEKKISQVWVNQTELGKKFGLSAVTVGKILIEHELKDSRNGQATQKAIEGGYAKSTPLKNGTPSFMWHLQRTKDLVSKKHVPLSEVDYWVNEVKKNLLEAEHLFEEGQDKLACMIADHVYEEVPQKIRVEVKAKIEL